MPNTVEQLNGEIGKLRQENSELRSELTRLGEQPAWFQRQVFGRRSERLTELPGTTDLLPGFENQASAETPEETETVASHSRRKPCRKGVDTLVLPATLERVERVVDVPEAERTLPDGTPMKCISEDRCEKLAFRPEEYYVLVTVRPKYAAPGDPLLGVLQEPVPPALIESSKFDVSFLAHLVEEKFACHMPLYRIAEKLAGRDIRVSRQVLASQLRTCGERVLPLFELMVERTLQQGVIFTDDSPVKLQQKGKCREARIWTYVGGGPNAPPYHVYQFSEDRGHRHPEIFLADFSGILHADAFGAYEKLHGNPDKPIQWAACRAHARREFEKAQSGHDDLRLWILRHMRCLFMYERVAWQRDPDERLCIRREREKPIIEEIFSKLREALIERQLLPKSSMAKAVNYMLSRPENFMLYLDNPSLRMDNNVAERSLRKLTIGRKNWLFIGSPRSGNSMAALLSLVQTCRAMDIRPCEYLTDLFTRLLDHPARRLEELLPDQWNRAREANP